MGTRNQQNNDDDEDAKKEAAEELRRMVVGIVKEQVGREVKSAIKGVDFGTMITDAVKPLLEGLKPAEQQQTTTTPQAGGIPPEVKKQIDDLAAANKKLADRLEAEQRSRTETEAKVRRKEERDTLAAALRKAGVPEALAAGAVALLGERGVIKRNDEGAIQWAQGDDVLDVEKGATAWLKSEEGRSFLPPRAVNGSGGGRGNPGAAGQNGQRVNKGDQIQEDIAFLAGMPDFGS